jgi:glycosyltransferase involved in cell wall biosynthesis
VTGQVLLLAYYFPPIGGAGVQRNPSLVRYLPDFGYRPLVVTGPGEAAGRWTPPDPGLGAALPGDAAVHRVAGPEPAAGRGSRAERWLQVPTPWQRWWTALAVETALEVGRDADLVHASIAPYSVAPAAQAVARALGKPLVVDLEDPWALDEMLAYPTGIHRRLALADMRRTLAAADAVVMNTPEAVLRVRTAFPELGATPVVSVTNGYEAEDFEGPAPPRDDGVFRIVHTGSFHTELGLRQRRRPLRRLLGGQAAGVDFLTRSHVYLLEAVDRLLAADPSLAGKLEVHLAGVLTETDLRVARRSPVVHLHGFVPHSETIGLIRSADLLFLPMHDLPPGQRAGLVPCKTYEYLASGMPVLAAVPDGDARDLLELVGSASVCRPADVTGMAEAIRTELERFRDGGRATAARPAALLRYERRHLASELATVYDQLLRSVSAVSPAGPRAVDAA